MIHLSLDYVLTGQRRGYTLTPADALPPPAQKAVWRGALPRGQGWDDPVLAGARSLKCFAIDDRSAVFSETTITTLRDEVGRGGIKQARIAVGSHAEIRGLLRRQLDVLPSAVTGRAEAALTSRAWALLFRRHRESARALKGQTILAAAYSSAAWAFVEAAVLLLATRTTLLANLIELSPAINPFADKLLSFTTLTLDPRDETRLIALPLTAPSLTGIPFIDLAQPLGG